VIRWIIRLFFAGEVEKVKKEMLSEARELIADAKASQKTKYVRYEPVPLESDSFLHGIQPIFGNRFFVSWIEAQREKRNRSIAECMANRDDEGALRALSQINMLDLLMMDLGTFKQRYDDMLERKTDAGQPE